MKTSDLQQMQQQYQLIAENNAEQASPMQQTYDKYVHMHMDLMGAIETMMEFMESDEFKFAANNDWMGIGEDDEVMVPSDFDEYVEVYLDHL